MANNDPSNEEVEVEGEPQVERSPFLGRAIIGAFVGVVITVECVMAYFWIPSKEQIAKAARMQAENAMQTTGLEESVKPSKKEVSVVEVDLGDITVTKHDAKTKSTLRIDFHPIGTVLASDQAKFEKLFKQFENRLQDQISSEIRQANTPDLTDPDLGLLKRRIKEKSNALLGKPIIREIFFSEFSIVQQ